MVSNKKKNKKHKKTRPQKHVDVADPVEHEDADVEAKLDNHSDTEASNEVSNKRQHEGDDNSDSEKEEKPRKKKKKKMFSDTSDATEKKGKKSIRQMKREKFAERQTAAETVAKNQLKSQCLNYLSQWKHDKQNWKFMKAKQVWLYKNKFSQKLIPDSSWTLFLEYFESAQGNIRKMLLDDSSKIIKRMDEWMESQNEKISISKEDIEDDTNEPDPSNEKPNEIVYKRARDLIQCLEE